MMFKATLEEPKLLKESMRTVNKLITEGTFKINEDKIELVAMNPSRVVMTIFRLFSSTFSKYEVEEPLDISLNLEKLVDILKRADSSDRLELEVDEEEQKLQIRMLGKTKRTFNLPLLDIIKEEEEIPDLEFSTEIELEPGFINSSVDDIALVSEAVKFEAKEDELKLTGKSGTNRAEVRLDKDSPTLINMEVGEETESKYALEYLKKISRANKVSDSLKMKFKTDHPLRLEYQNPDKLEMNFILAPRVEAE